MRTARVIELLSGVVAGALGLLTLAWLLFGPASHYVRSVTTCTSVPNDFTCISTGPDHITTGPIEIDIFPLSIFLLGVLALLFAAVAASAALHSLAGNTLWQACLWVATALLAGILLLAMWSLLLALLPALALAVVASAAAWWAARQRGRQGEQQSGVARWMEIVGGVAASLLGLGVSAYLLTAPNQGMSSSDICDSQGICQMTTSGSTSPLLADPVGTLPLAILAVAAFGLLAFSVIRHSRTGAHAWLAWVWGISLLLMVFSFLAILSIGGFFLPSALLALLAAICSFGPAPAALRPRV